MRVFFHNAAYWVLWLFLALASFHLYFFQPFHGVLMDLSVYIEAGKRFREGQDIYQHIYEVTARDGRLFKLYYFYPPLLAAVISTFASLSYPLIKASWCVMNLVCIAGSTFFLSEVFRSVVPKQSAKRILPCILFSIIAYEPAFTTAMEGQINFLILFLLSAALWGALRGKDSLLGFCVGTSASIKISPALLVLGFLSEKRWRALGVLAGLVTLLSALPFLLSPQPLLLLQFFSPFESLALGTLERHYVFNYAADKALLGIMGLDSLPFARTTVRLMLYLLPLLLIFLSLKKRKADNASPLILYGTLIACMVLISPTLWFHHLVWLIPVFVILAARIFRRISDDTEDKEKLYKELLLIGTCYFISSQANQLHVLALRNGGSLIYFTALVPALSIVALIIMLRRSA